MAKAEASVEVYAGDYRANRVILEIYDAMLETIRIGEPYNTRIDSPLGRRSSRFAMRRPASCQLDGPHSPAETEAK